MTKDPVRWAAVQPEKPKLKQFLLVALAVAVVAFCATLIWI